MVRLKVKPPRHGGSHEANDIVPNRPVRAHQTSPPNNHPKISIKPLLSNLPLSISQLSSLVESSISAPSGTIQENKAVDVIRGSYIPDHDLAIIPNWTTQLQHRPDLSSTFKLSDLKLQGLHTNSLAPQVSMARPLTRSRARDSLRAGSITQTVPQKRKRVVPKSKKSPETDSSAKNEKVEAIEKKGSSTSSVAQNDSPSEASSRLTITVKCQQPETPDLKLKSTEPGSTSPCVDDDFQALGGPSAISSPEEGDSGISLASLEKEASIPKENGAHETSIVPAEPSVLTDTLERKNGLLGERLLDDTDAHPATVPEAQSETGTAPQPTIAVQDTPAFIELPHNLGIVPAFTGAASSTAPSTGLPKESQSQPLGERAIADPAVNDKLSVDAAISTTPATQEAETGTKKAKKFNYGLTPGQSPFPDFKAPSPEACYVVNDLLTQAHGEVIAPKTIPDPSLTVTGCGEVPSVLDALIRTLLSGATTGSNSARAFNGLVQRFGTLTEGIGKGSVNWDAVRQAPLRDVFEAIESGGLADIKSKNLKALLDQVYEENQERKNRHTAEVVSAANNEGPSMSSDAAKQAEEVKEYDIASANDHFLNLQYIHKYGTPNAMKALIRYPGIGPKTAACVLLFCLQRPCFAVDTHIFRICKWLGWIPDKANEIAAFSHLDVKIPDELKYSLHQLFIKHGKECPRCRAITSPTSADWDKGCIIEELVKRTGRKKVGPAHQHVQAGPAKQTPSRKTTIVKKGTKGKRASAKAKTTKKKANATRATKKSADKQINALQGPSAASVDQPEASQSLVDSTQDAAQPNPLKRKHLDPVAKAPQKKKPGRPGKKPSRAASSRAKSRKSKKKPATRNSSAQKPAKKEKPAPRAGIRSSPRLKRS
jgi:endonuclease III